MIIGAAILGAFFVLELVTALTINSIALLADAGHDAHRPGRDVHGPDRGAAGPSADPPPRPATYGWHRAEVFTAVANAALLLGVAGFILYEAFERFGDAPDVPGVPLIVVALAGLAANAVVVLLLRSDSEHSLAVKGAYMEVVADTVGSIGVLIAGIVTVTTGWPLRRRRRRRPGRPVGAAAGVLLSPGPRCGSCQRVVACPYRRRRVAHRPARDVPGVTEVHDLHVWTLVPGRDMATAHLTSTDDAGASAGRRPGRVLAAARSRTRHRPGRAARRRRRLRREELPSSPRGAARADGSQSSSSRSSSARTRGVSPISGGGPGQRGHAAQEATVGLVRVGHRTEALPAVAPQLVEAAVIPGAGIGVGGHRPGPRPAPARQVSPMPPRHIGCAGGDDRRCSRRRPARLQLPVSPGSSTGSGPSRSPIPRHRPIVPCGRMPAVISACALQRSRGRTAAGMSIQQSPKAGKPEPDPDAPETDDSAGRRFTAPSGVRRIHPDHQSAPEPPPRSSPPVNPPR